MAAESVSQVSSVPQSTTVVRRKNHRSAKVLMIKVTKRPESALQQRCDLPLLFKLGRWCEIVPRSPVIGRMVVIDLGVNVCASLSPPISPFNPQLSPGILSPSCENSAATPSPRNPGGFAAKGDQRRVSRQNPPVGTSGGC